MPPPSHLAIATSSVKRLLKEEASYYKELAQQEAQIKALKEKIESGQGIEDDNGDFMLKQQVRAPLISLSLLSRLASQLNKDRVLTEMTQETAVEQTKAVFGPLRERLDAAVAKLEDQIQVREQSGAPEQEMEAAKATLAQVKAEQNGSS